MEPALRFPENNLSVFDEPTSFVLAPYSLTVAHIPLVGSLACPGDPTAITTPPPSSPPGTCPPAARPQRHAGIRRGSPGGRAP